MLETVGKKLAKIRRSKELSIEDVEHRTRIPGGRLRDLEDDDYSRFANLTYAKSFLKLYSDYLEIDTTDYLQELSLYEVDDFGADPLANEYSEQEGSGRRPAFFVGVVVLLAASLAGAYFISEYYRAQGEKDPAVAVGEGAEGIGGGGEGLKPGAKPPGEVAEEVRPATLGNLVKPRIGTGEDGIPKTGPGSLPVVPAEVVDDKPLKAIPVDGGGA